MAISICYTHNTSNRRNEKTIREKIMNMEKDRRMSVRIFSVLKFFRVKYEFNNVH